jgi:hypothetical protein
MTSVRKTLMSEIDQLYSTIHNLFLETVLMNAPRRCFLAILAIVGLSMPGTAVAATLVLSLDGNVGVTTSGSTVTGWTDQSGSGNNASGTGPYAAAPTYETNIGAINGKNALKFSAPSVAAASAQALNVPFSSAISQPLTVFLVGQIIGNNGAGTAADYFFDGSNGASRTALSTFSTPTMGLFAGAGPIQSTAAYGGFHIYQAVFNGNFSRLYQDGTLVLNNSNVGGNGINTSGLLLGARYTSGFGLNGHIANVKVYSGLMTSEEVNAVGYNLQATYGLSGVYVPEPSSILLVCFASLSLCRTVRLRRRSA